MKKALSLLCLGLLVLTACDFNAPPAPTAPAPALATATPTSTPVPPTPTPRPIPQVLRLHLSADPSTIDPQQASASDETDIVMMVFSNLLAFDADGNLTPETAVALPTLSPDGLTYTFRLKPGRKYSDGRPLTAKDFEYGWKRQLDPALASDNAVNAFVLAGAEAYHSAASRKAGKEELQKLRDAVGVRALDEQTLEFRLTARAPYFLSMLAVWNGLPARQDLVEKHGNKWTEPSTYIGNGPYVLSEWKRQARLVFTANPNYARGKPPIERIEMIVSDSTAALMAYQNGEIDAMRLGAPELNRTGAQSDAKLKAQLTQRVAPCTFYIGFNTTKAPFDKVAVRRAFAQALDKEQYARTIEKDLALPADQFVPPGLPGHYADLKTPKFDAAAARRDLAQAGFANGAGLPEIRYGYVASPRNQLRAEWLLTQWKTHLGAQVKADPLDAQTYRVNGAKPETMPHLFMYGWCQNYPDPHDWYSTVFDSRSIAPYRTGWKNDRFDQLTREADRELDPQKRLELYRQAAQLLADNAPVAFLYNAAELWLVKPHIGGAKLTPLDVYFSSASVMSLKVLPR